MVECVDCAFEFKTTPESPTGLIQMQKSGWRTWSDCRSSKFLEFGHIQERSPMDIVMARSSFIYNGPLRGATGYQFEFVIERGQITMHYRES